MVPDTGMRRARWSSRRLTLAACVVAMLSVGAFTVPNLHTQVLVSGVAVPDASIGTSDEDQIRIVLQAISDAYNRKDVRAAQDSLCARSRSQWSPQLERVWMAYRLRHGAMEFTIRSVEVTGVVARVTGTQTYFNDVVPQKFTAEMGRSPSGWRMCSST
ncbi:hypothetical protein MMAD_09510 [Mycolicibacterium madagascariense]|uniref:Uncharacterized protein n=1 Tax=Mycolicibacterium madagascariense TaxID=212765 RepID=A0A7I7XAH3_9MYCO|nr:hypothetical protein [Mycolicibacterium madagascariense]MCV7014946.1 hypothetical protein [Mycolicibacterium madagascariense]BBZ26656.1 hypothetical protein MMAD_09510 [Mycolicibacterium madagascariense]